MRKPRQRTGTALPNEDAHQAAEGRLASGARYQTDPGRTVMTPKLKPMPRTAPLDIPTVDPEDLATPNLNIGQPAPRPAPKAGDKTKKPSEPTPSPAANSEPPPAEDRTQWAYAVRTLPAQRARISDIARVMNVSPDYIETALRKAVRMRLNTLRDKADWSSLTEDAVRRVGDANAEGQALFKATLQLTDAEYRRISAAVNDPLDMIAPFRVISAFAKVAFARELEALDRKAAKK